MSIQLPTRALVSQQDHAMIQRPDVPRSRFLGSWTLKTTFDAGKLIPILLDEVLPGDHLKYEVTAYLRMATPLFPMFDNMKVETFFFFVPNRLVWENWTKFMGEQANPGDSIAYTIPVINSPAGGFPQNSLFDYMGVPVNGQITAGQTIAVNALPFRAYNLIYNEWFRDENLINSRPISFLDGPEVQDNYQLVNRAKAHDRFTSALPWPQKFTAPNVPMTGQAPITGLGRNDTTYTVGPLNVTETGGAVVSYPFYSAANGTWQMRGSSQAGGQPQVFANLSAATATFTINTLRQAWMTQALMERDARGGTRYTEIVRSHFGVISPDARLQRPEYIGGGSSPLTLTPIAQTAPTTGVPLGALGAAGTATGQHAATVAATEHGYVIGLINVRSELSYQQGLHKMFTRSTRYDFYWPSLAGLGEQTILRQELYATGVDADDVTVFGYEPRHEEYRQRSSMVTGKFRSTATGTLDAWHLSQRFTAPPVLGQTFIEDTPPMDRVLAAGALAANQQFLADILVRRDATRPVPLYGTPAALGRF